MKTSTGWILSTHVGSIPRPESIGALLRARPPGNGGNEGNGQEELRCTSYLQPIGIGGASVTARDGPRYTEGASDARSSLG
jgi:hypothetical protein